MALSVKEKRTIALRRLAIDLERQGINVVGVNKDLYLEIKDKDFNDRKITVRLVNLKQVQIVITIHDFEYTKLIESKRDAVKTAKDISDFHNELSLGKMDKINSTLHGLKFKPLGLMYANKPSEGCVSLFHHFNEYTTKFSFNAAEILRERTLRINAFLKLIEVDRLDPNSRWDKEVAIGKNWWQH